MSAEIQLLSWAGYRATRRPRRDLEPAAKRSDGVATLFIDEPPSREQNAAMLFIREYEADVSNAVLQAIVNAYPAIRESALDFIEEDEIEELIPEIETPDDLRALIGLTSVHVLPVARDGLACVGFAFGCTWEEEHGLGVLTHAGRILALGSAETAFDERAAEAP